VCSKVSKKKVFDVLMMFDGHRSADRSISHEKPPQRKHKASKKLPKKGEKDTKKGFLRVGLYVFTRKKGSRSHDPFLEAFSTLLECLRLRLTKGRPNDNDNMAQRLSKVTCLVALYCIHSRRYAVDVYIYSTNNICTNAMLKCQRTKVTVNI
jgi:hypothetical protein